MESYHLVLSQYPPFVTKFIEFNDRKGVAKAFNSTLRPSMEINAIAQIFWLTLTIYLNCDFGTYIVLGTRHVSSSVAIRYNTILHLPSLIIQRKWRKWLWLIHHSTVPWHQGFVWVRLRHIILVNLSWIASNNTRVSFLNHATAHTPNLVYKRRWLRLPMRPFSLHW